MVGAGIISTQARTQIAALGVALLLILAGCSSASQQPTVQTRSVQPATDSPTPTPTTTATPTTATTATPTTTPPQKTTLEKGDVTYYNATESKIQAVNNTMSRFFRKLPDNKSERTATVAKVANESCHLSPVNKTVFTSASFAHERGLQLYHVARVMEANYNSKINPARIRRVARTSAKIGKYTTIIGSYNHYRKTACAFDRDKPETMEDFYLASATLGFELLMFQYGMYYKTAFKANRVLSHRRTYRVVQSTFGDEALGLMMSGSYHLVHGTLQAAPKFVREQADELNITIDSDAAREDRHQAVGQFVGKKVVPRDMSKAATQCYDKISNSTDQGGLLNQAKDAVTDLSNEFLDGEYTVSSVLESARGINPSELSEKQMKKIQKCIQQEGAG